jgi:hypothetical protein
MVLLLWSSLFDERTGLSSVYAAGPHQRSLSQVRFPWNSWPYFTLSDLRLPVSSPPTTRRFTVEVFGAASIRVLSGSTRVESYVTADNQSASLSWNKEPIWGLLPDFYYCQTVACLLMWGALSDERTGLSFIIDSGPLQRSHSRVRVPWDSQSYFSVSDSRLPFSSPPTTRRATVEEFDPACTPDCLAFSIWIAPIFLPCNHFSRIAQNIHFPTILSCFYGWFPSDSPDIADVFRSLPRSSRCPSGRFEVPAKQQIYTLQYSSFRFWN